MVNEMESLLKTIRACEICTDLPLGPRPVLQAQSSAKILLIGQAPGTKVHATGIPWNDPSGDRLRDWMNIDRDTFYDDSRIAFMPMGFCYPGKLERGGDKPPRPECAPAWHEKVMAALPDIQLTLLIGLYAQGYYLKERKSKTLTGTVERWREFLPEIIVTPHPSWRTTGWQRKNPWYEDDLIPVLRRRVLELL
jgi:uracil-DNA glycosylase